MTVFNKVIEAAGFCQISKRFGKPYAKAGKNLATEVTKNPGRAYQIGAKNGSAAVSKNAKADLFSSSFRKISLSYW